ncbi:hypothetical protein [Roseinatronobacter alkalisoli]|uniref:Glycosyltransferase n=1 Tax=Roseinatronobacter alkalisoli TaxID=3028235 RepID=A0ABT5TEN7_9RHOB|nr:hypothetical protein [Roseinatronobacter sp. HJB301]MDD7973588.1 hypothetical protein [Roseinatronobacter sp. HJB301]
MNQVAQPKIIPQPKDVLRFLSSWDYRAEVFRITDLVVARNIVDLDAIRALCPQDEILVELISYLARARRHVLALEKPLSLGVVFAVWKEVRRLQPNSDTNPTGEDALRAKVAELNWLFRDTPHRWGLYIVDDDCPEDSLRVARAIAEAEALSDVYFLRLADALPAPDLPMSRLKSAALSTKGGAIHLGMLQAACDGHDYVMYTDCDNSNHMGQAGLLLHELADHGKKVALGDRRSTRVLEWQTSRESESYGNYVIKRVQALLDFDLLLGDVTCPFKMFEREYLLDMLPVMNVFDFTIDFDILGYVKTSGAPVAIVPVVSVDSDFETTWISLTNVRVWLQKLQGFLYVIQKYALPHNPEAVRLVREKLWTAEQIRKVLSVSENGVFRNGQKLTIDEQLGMSLAEVDAWITHAQGQP